MTESTDYICDSENSDREWCDENCTGEVTEDCILKYLEKN